MQIKTLVILGQFLVTLVSPNAFRNISSKKLHLLTELEQQRASNEWMKDCVINAAFCCWTKGVKQSNTKLYESPKTTIHCHGTVIDKTTKNGITDAQITLNYIQVYDHLKKRGYYGSVMGYNACDCAENMPKVKRADASQLKTNFTVDSSGNADPTNARNFRAGKRNDLECEYKARYSKYPQMI